MQTTTTAYLKALKILFIALAVFQIALAVIAFILISTGFSSNSPDLLPVFTYLIPVLCAVMVFVSVITFKTKISKVDSSGSLKDKLDAYRGLYITRCALIEGPVIFTIIAYLLTGAQMFLIIAIVMLLIFISFYPSLQKIIKELPLSSTEQAILNDPNGVIE
jgi:hypothetical protein